MFGPHDNFSIEDGHVIPGQILSSSIYWKELKNAKINSRPDSQGIYRQEKRNSIRNLVKSQNFQMACMKF